jgi:nicotinamidase-related amidase
MKQGLLLVDIQNDYFPGGKMELVGMKEAAQKALLLLQKFRDERAPVFHIQHISNRPGAAFFLPGTRGAEIHESLAPETGERIIEKHFPNSFRDTPLLTCLKERTVDEVVICGAMTHMCIDATTRAAFDFGFRCVVVQDACATRDVQFRGENVSAAKVHAAFMAALAAPYGQVIDAAEFPGIPV